MCEHIQALGLDADEEMLVAEMQLKDLEITMLKIALWEARNN